MIDEKDETLTKLNSQEEIVRRQQYFKMVELEREKCEDPGVAKPPVEQVVEKPVETEKPADKEESKSNLMPD